jgi:hypothetical protein
MTQTITPDLADLLTSKLQAGPLRGFRGEIEIGGGVGGCEGYMRTGTSEGVVDLTLTLDAPPTTVVRYRALIRTINAQLYHVWDFGVGVTDQVRISYRQDTQLLIAADNNVGDLGVGFDVSAVDFETQHYLFVEVDTTAGVIRGTLSTSSTDPVSWDVEESYTTADPDLSDVRLRLIAGDNDVSWVFETIEISLDGGAYETLDEFSRGPDDNWGTSVHGEDWIPDHSNDALDVIICENAKTIVSMSLDRSRKMQAAQLDVELENEAGDKGWYQQTLATFVPNAPITAWAWYGVRANRVCIFTGLIDICHDHRNPRKLSLKARSRMKWLFEQNFTAIASQVDGEDGAILTELNGVFIEKSVAYIVNKILDLGGWPTGDARVITDPGITLSLFVIPDQTSWVDAIAGSDRLTSVAGYDLWEDELGVIHFGPSPITASSEPSPTYTLQAGVDILTLDHETDDTERKTRVRVGGPMKSFIPAWKETWETTRLDHPVGVWHEPTDASNVRVIDSITQYLYVMRRSDQTIVSSVNLRAAFAYFPGGLSGDPVDPTIYWALDINWIHGGNDNARVIKFDKATNAVLDTYALPDGQWTDLKSDGVNLWLTRWDTDRLYKRDLTGGAVDSWTYASHVNPTGMYLNGTTIGLFFNGGTKFYLVSTSDPGTITSTQSTVGTQILGGEMVLSTQAALFAVLGQGPFSSAGHVWEFELKTEITTDVVAWASDMALEHQLGAQSNIGTRAHDLDPAQDDHQFETRLLVINLEVVTSVAQATQVAVDALALMKRLRRQMDVGWVGNPALQINDVIFIDDPVENPSNPWVLDTYRLELDEKQFIGSGTLLPWELSTVGDGGGVSGGGGAGSGDEDLPAGTIPPIPGGTGTVFLKDFSDGTLGDFNILTYPNDHPGDLMIEYGLFSSSQVSIHDDYLDVRSTAQSGPSSRLQGMVGTFINDGNPPTHTFDFLYGTISFAARMNVGVGLWQSLWLLAAYEPPEIDIAEMIDQLITSHLHGTSADGQFASETPFDPEEWHIYTLIWTATDVTVEIDGVPVGTVAVVIVDPMCILIDSKVGLTPPDGTTPTIAYMHVAWVTVD